MAVTVDNTKGAYTIPALSGSGYVPIGGGTMTGALTIASGTLTASAPALNITQTWTTGAAFTGAVMNITDTSSTAGSLFQDWQVGGVSKLNIKKDGSLTWGANARIESDTAQIYITHVGSGRTWASFRGYTTGLTFNTESGVVWCSSTNATAGTQDLFLVRDAAAQLAQRNGTNAQTLRVYSTYTSASVYSRASLAATTTAVTLAAEELSTGSPNVDIVLTPAGTGRVLFGGNFYFYPSSGISIVYSDSAKFAFGASSDTGFGRLSAGVLEVTNSTSGQWRDLKLRNLIQTAYHEVAEMTAPAAPATNSVRIYAEDNGAGKTRLMALFATGSAVQLGIEP